MVKRARPKGLQIRLSEDEKSAMKAKAESEGLNLSSWIRRHAILALKRGGGED